METYDYSRLLGRMKEYDFTQERLAQQISMNVSTLNQKLNNKSEFSQREMLRITQVLNLRAEEIPSYFFVL